MSGHPSAGQLSGLHLRSLPNVALVLGLLVQAVPAAADLISADRRTTWNPGIPGGVPVRTTICATVNASTYGNGTSDASAGIQAALDACPAGQVVKLSAGTFTVNNRYLAITNGI